MATGKQIRAARAWAGWERGELAKRVGVSVMTIQNIELEVKRPRLKTIEKILKAFSEAGIELKGDSAVELQDERLKTIIGKDCYLRLLDEVYLTLRGKKDGEALFLCVDDTLSSQEVIDANMLIRNAGIKCRYLCSDQAKKFDYPIEDYRTIPTDRFRNSVMIVYGEKVATLRDKNEGVLVVIDKNQAAMLRGLFEIIWEQAPKPKKGA